MKEVMNMKQLMKTMLAVMLLLALAAPALAAEEVSVYIPNRLDRLQLADEDCYEGDPFKTGMEGAVTEVEYDESVVPTSCGGLKRLEYIRKVTVKYPAGNCIRKVTAEFGNDRKKSLTKYTITYQTGDREFYTISYAPRTNTILEDHFQGAIYFHDHGVHSMTNGDTGDTYTINADANLPSMTVFTDSNGGVYLHHYEADEILQGEYTDGSVTLKTGSGNNAGSWYLWDSVSGGATRVRKGGLRSPFSFKSPRVK